VSNNAVMLDKEPIENVDQEEDEDDEEDQIIKKL
jgi:hypothetical protein